MTKRWGNDERGPGGDPSWLGGKDRGGQGGMPGSTGEGGSASGADGRSGPLPEGDSGWSSDFGPTGSGQRADQDFGSSSGRADSPEHTGPRFGSFGEDGTGGDPERAPQQHGAEADGATGTPTLKQIFGALIPTIVIVVVAIVFFRADFSFWWIAFVVILPTIRRFTRLFGGGRRR